MTPAKTQRLAEVLGPFWGHPGVILGPLGLLRGCLGRLVARMLWPCKVKLQFQAAKESHSKTSKNHWKNNGFRQPEGRPQPAKQSLEAVSLGIKVPKGEVEEQVGCKSGPR